MDAVPDQHVHHGHSHGHGDGHHSHAHGPHSPHPPSQLPVSLLRWSLASRLGVATLATLALWGAVLIAMR
jgi:hypothetical protein